MRFSSKEELLSAIEAGHEALVQLLATIPTERYLEPGVWGDEWNIRDLLTHLTTYLSANTVSHYRTASRILRRWLRSQALTTVPHTGDSHG